MNFKPFSKKYSFSKDVLTEEFPPFIHTPISNWILNVLRMNDLVTREYFSAPWYLNSDFHIELQITFRETFPTSWRKVSDYILEDSERTSNFLALCLQNYTSADLAISLEEILASSGSGFEVMKMDKKSLDSDLGNYDLTKRVSKVVKAQAESALQKNKLLEEAWNYCYSRNPDYEKVVSRACDFLERFLGDKYYPQDPKPQLLKFIHFFESDPNILSYKGDSIINPKSNLTDLLIEASNIRGQHTGGKGRNPTKEEAEFVLHAAIFIWNMHN